MSIVFPNYFRFFCGHAAEPARVLPYTEDHPHTEGKSCNFWRMPSLDKAFSDFLKKLRGAQSYASLAKKLGVSESTMYRLTNGGQSVTLRGLDNMLKRLGFSLADVFADELYRKRGRRG